jgi:V8-like Glu-specific endopeptidase
MIKENEVIENSIYAIVSFPIKDIPFLENNKEYEIVVKGINGTCFFVSPNRFITAHHCLNKFYAEKQIYFLINKTGHIINGVQIEEENSMTDMCVGKIGTSIDYYCKFPNQSFTFIGGQEFIAYGYSRNDTQNLRMKILKVNNELRIIEHDPLILKKIKYKLIKPLFLENHLSNDLVPIHLRDCNVLIFDKSLESGFSGGPTFNKETNEVVGFASQDLYLQNIKDAVMIVIPVTGN